MFRPRYQITPNLLKSIKTITVLVHELDRCVVSDVVQMQMLEKARAVSTFASTSIEGNPLPLTEVKRLLKRQPTRLRQSEQEVVNYNAALMALNERLNEQPDAPLTLEHLLDIHRRILQDLLPTYQAGALRQEPVVVHDPRSGEVVYLPPDHADVPLLVADLLAFVEANRKTLDPVLLAGIFHKQLVVIHPFVDGNGRTTRLATKHLLAGLGLNTFDLFSFENYYNQNVTRYFQEVGAFGNYYELADSLDFTAWLTYFAGGILDELQRVQKQIERNLATPESTLKPYHQAVLHHIDERGFITDRDYAQLTDRAKATRALDFKFLIERNLIERKGRGRGIYYQRVSGE